MPSVWNEQIDIALKEEIQKHTIRREKSGRYIRLPDEAIIVRKPEEDFKSEVYPCVSYFEQSAEFVSSRYNPIPVPIKRNADSHLITLEETAIPFNVTYQIEFWAKYQKDINEITQSWLLKHFRQFNLDLKDDNGIVRSSNVLLQPPITRSDLISGKERIFRNIFNYVIWVELDNESRYNVSMVTDVVIDTGTEEKLHENHCRK